MRDIRRSVYSRQRQRMMHKTEDAMASHDLQYVRPVNRFVADCADCRDGVRR